MARLPIAAPPASKANVPVELKTIDVAGAVNGIDGCNPSSGEYTYKVLPPLPRIKTFNSSGENAAAIALLMFRGVELGVVDPVLTTYT